MEEEEVALEAFRKSVIETSKFICPPGTDGKNVYYLRFLRAKNMDIEKAIAMYQRYHEMRKRNKDTFCKMLPSTLKHVLESGIVTKLPGMDNEGRAVFLFRFKLWNTKEISMDQVYLACVLLLEEMSCIQECQRKGVVMIHDYEGFEFSHFRQMTMRNFIRILQIMQVFYPLVPEKLRKRIFMYGSDVNLLTTHFPEDSLPGNLGGISESCWDYEFFDRIFEREPYYECLASSLF